MSKQRTSQEFKTGSAGQSQADEPYRKAKFEVYGEEMIEKQVKQSGNSGRVYLPPEWIGKNVKIIRID
jgi:putative transposon-encoded protein